MPIRAVVIGLSSAGFFVWDGSEQLPCRAKTTRN